MNISFIGSGKVATQMAIAFKNAGFDVLEIYSRNFANAEALASKIGAKAVNKIEDLAQAELYIISTSDDAIPELAQILRGNGALVVHTSGATSLDALGGVSENYGVFYPLQTFSTSRAADFREIPLCIEANTEANTQKLTDLAHKISHRVFEIDSSQRKVLHLAAVFACNFTNHLFTLSAEMLEKEGMSFDILKPLIQETCDKVMDTMPFEAQTGPALRGDEQTLAAHLNMLSAQPQMREIYHLLSDSIKKTHS